MTMNSRLIQRARELVQAGHPADARTVLDAVLLAEPDNEIAWQLRLTASDTPADREQALRALLWLHPEDIDLLDQLVDVKIPEAPVRKEQRYYRALYLAAALLIIVTAAAALYFVSHNPLQKDVDQLTTYNHDLTRQIQQLDRQLQLLRSENRELQARYERLQTDYTSLQAQHADLVDQYNQLVANFNRLQQDYGQLTYEYRTFRDTAIAPPYIYIHERRIELVFKRTNGNMDRWWIDFEGLEGAIEQGSALRNPNSNGIHTVNLEGYPYPRMDFRPFVISTPFKDVMSQLYYEVGQDEQAFLYETWHIMGQLTGYVTDTNTLRDTPRYPLETLLSGGGDCEDTSILFASLIKAAPVNWRVSLFYMDGNHPVNTQEVNHVIVLVETPAGKHFIETTSHSEMEPYIRTGIHGWELRIQLRSASVKALVGSARCACKQTWLRGTAD